MSEFPPLSGELLPPSPPVRASLREVGFNGLDGSALAARARADQRAVLKAQIEEILSGATQVAARFALDLISDGIEERERAREAGERPDKDVMRRAERALDRWFDRVVGKPTQAVAVESRGELFVVLADVVRGVSGGDR